jgi:aromatic-amino-acid transaminase
VVAAEQMSFLIPSRCERPNDDPIFTLNAEALARRSRGEDVLNATVGALLDEEGRLAVLGTAAQTLRELDALEFAAYAPIAGTPAFQQAVIADLLGDRPEAAWALAVATPGGTGAIRLAIANFVERGESVLTTSFYWGPYKTLAEEGDRRLSTFGMFNEQGGLDAADLERRLTEQLGAQGRALLVLNAPCHNPTGYSFDDDEWSAIADILGRASSRGPISLLIDVAYLHYAAIDLSSCLIRVLGLAGKVLPLFAWSASKSFTEYGLRVGALVAVHPDPAHRAHLKAALSYSCRGTWSNCNAGGMAAITRLLSEPELRARVERERALLKGLLSKRVLRWNELASKAKLRYPRYDGGFFTTVFCEDAQGVAVRLKADGIFVVPQAGALRVALCSVPEHDIARLVAGIARHVS